MKRHLLIPIIAGLLIAPASATLAQSGTGGSQDTIEDTDQIQFYGHVFDTGRGAPMPANTQFPVGEANLGLGQYDWCTPAARASLGSVAQENCDEDPLNELWLFSTAGLVGVDNDNEFTAGGGYAQLHNERGQTKDIQLDTSGDFSATVHLSVDFHAWAAGGGETSCVPPHPPNMPCLYPSWGWDPGAQPDFVVEANLYHADLGNRSTTSEAPPIAESVESGNTKLIASGQWGPDMVMTGLPGSPNSIEFTIPMEPQGVETIPRTDDFFIEYEVYSTSPAGDVGIHSVRWWTGEFFPPSFTMPVENAFTVERVVPNFNHGKLALLGIINTPWGSYDINADSIDLTVTGPEGQTLDPEHLDRFADFSVAHGGHYKPVNVTWIWDYKKEGLDPGEYTVSVSAENMQGSAAAECTATFTVEEATDGALIPGPATEGICGTQSVSEEDVGDLQADADQDGGNES